MDNNWKMLLCWS